MARLKAKWPSIHYHQWIEYADANGSGRCEPEAYVVFPDRIVLFECKLTGCALGRTQMEHLYAPLLAHIYARPVVCVQLCKSLTSATPGPFIDSLDDVEALPRTVPYATLQMAR